MHKIIDIVKSLSQEPVTGGRYFIALSTFTENYNNLNVNADIHALPPELYTVTWT